MKLPNGNNRLQFLRKSLFILLIVIAACMVADIAYVYQFNHIQHTIIGNEDSNGVSMNISGRSGDTNKWLKRDYDLYGETVDLQAQTFDGNFVNNSKYDLKKWQMRININSDCFVNQIWCGNVEIHQFVDGEERVQNLDLRDYELEDVTLDYLYDGDLLISLHKGDYIIYYPSDADGELSLEKNKQVTIGLIMYYLEEPDLNDFELTYTFDRQYRDGANFYVILLLLTVWFISLMVYVVSDVTYKNTVREMEVKKSGIASMSDMYSIIYIIDIIKDELMPVVADEESERVRPKHMSASEQLRNMFNFDCVESFKDMAKEFCDFSTLEERLSTRSTVAFEYISESYGWCRLRFFEMERDDEGNLEKVVFAIQVINEEKQEMEAIAQRVDEVEHESKAKSTFLANMSHEIRTPINTVIGLNTMILRESKEPEIRSYAKSINSASSMLLSIVNGILDLSKIEADKMELVPEEYSFRELLTDVINMVKTRAEFERLEFICDVSGNLPDKVYGDKVRLKQVIINLITNAAKYTDEGSVKLSVFGKNMGDKVHLLISVKDTGIGIREEDLAKLTERFARFDEKRNHSVEGTGIGLSLVRAILELMDTELHVVSEYGHGSEFYFEVEQDVIEAAPIGQIEFDMMEDEQSYQALFTAPDARVLVVDDNVMNLTVFEELLKETQLQIDAVSSGASALLKTLKSKYDLIFMDHMMPDMDGIETLHNIRVQDGGLNRDTKVIVLTANAVKGAEEEYRKAGFDDFLTKPIQPDLLESKIMEYLDPSKVNKNTASAKRAEKQQASSAALPTIPGVDVAFGVNHTGGMSSYLSVLKQFVNVAASDLEELQGYMEAIAADNSDRDAIKSYRIKVHAMKATAHMMGAFEVYGVAMLLEGAAANEKVQELIDISPYFFDEWSRLKNLVEKDVPQIKDTTGKQEKLGNDEMLSLFHLLETSIKAYDIKNADSVMDKLAGYEWTDEESAVLNELKTAVANLDADGAIELSNKLKSLMGMTNE